MARYVYVVADLLTGTVRDEIPFSGVTYGHVLNAPGGFTGSLPSRHPKCTLDNLAPGKTALYVLREGGNAVNCVWGGIVWTARKAEGFGGDVQFGAEGFWSYARRRKLKVDLSYAATDQATIARALITYMNGVHPSGNIGIVNGAQTTSVLRERNYFGYDRQFIGDLVEALSAVENGFDFSIDVTFDGVSTFTKTFNIYYPYRGRVTGLTWEIGVHCDYNGWGMDATQMANSVDAIGAGEGATMIIANASDPGTGYPLLEMDAAHKTVIEQTTLTSHAQDLLAARRLPSTMPDVNLRPTQDTSFGAFQVGDVVTLRGNDGFAAIDGGYRIMNYEVAVSDEGDESTKCNFQDMQVAY